MSIIKTCECGCGQEVTYNKYRLRRFISGHQFKIFKNTTYIFGDKNNLWRGGIRYRHGYIYKKNYTHPYKDSDNYVATHRLIYENYLSVLLDEEIFIPKVFEVHHINGIKDDNRLINLELLPGKIHRQLRYEKGYVRQSLFSL